MPLGGWMQGGEVPVVTAFQQAYMKRWAESNLCEEIALLILRLNFGLGPEDIIVTGKGALSEELLDDPLESPPDFYVPELNMWFEVTSSDLTREESLQRCYQNLSISYDSLYAEYKKLNIPLNIQRRTEDATIV